MGYVDEVLFGYEVVERLPGIIRELVATHREKFQDTKAELA